MDKLNKSLFIIIIVGTLLLGIGFSSLFFGPNIKKLRKERKALFEQIDQKLEDNENLRKKILKEREGWIKLVDTLEQEIILIDKRITDKETALKDHEIKNNEALDSLTNLPDSLHQEFLSNEFGIKFD